MLSIFHLCLNVIPPWRGLGVRSWKKRTSILSMHRQPELQHCFQANPSISNEQTHTSGLCGIDIGARLRNNWSYFQEITPLWQSLRITYDCQVTLRACHSDFERLDTNKSYESAWLEKPSIVCNIQQKCLRVYKWCKILSKFTYRSIGVFHVESPQSPRYYFDIVIRSQPRSHDLDLILFGWSQ